MSNVLRYPVAPIFGEEGDSATDPSTLATDYLMLHRHKVNYSDRGSHNNFYTRKYPGNRQSLVYNDTVCYVAMPPSIQTAYGPAYKRMDIGASGIALTNMINSGTDMSAIADELQTAAKAALPEFGTGAAISIANSFNQFLGLQGSTDLNTIEMLRKGRIFNPYSEQIFAGMSFRTHNFAFKFFIRNRKEARHVFRIIRYLKMGALPDIVGSEFDKKLVNTSNEVDKPKGQEDIKRSDKYDDPFDREFFQKMDSGYANSDRYFYAPDRFDLRFVRFANGTNRNKDGVLVPGDPPGMTVGTGRLQDDQVDGNRTDLHFLMYPSVCTGLQVNYTPDNQYISRKRPHRAAMDVPAVVVSASFTETRLLTRSDAQRGY